MAELSPSFREFLTNIRPSAPQREEMRDGYCTLRNRLRDSDDLKDFYVADFLQGSYRRSTAIRPSSGERSDVDLVVVTNLDSSVVTPADVLELFKPFADRYYKGKWEPNGRSIGIELSYVELDLVITAAPSEQAQKALGWDAITTLAALDEDEMQNWRLNEHWVGPEHRDQLSAVSRMHKSLAAAEWRSEPLLIPDRGVAAWEKTHPLAQIEWTFAKNATTNRHYVNVVKAIKWWWRTQHTDRKYPKGYPLEHMVGDTCPDGIESVAEGIARCFEEIRDHQDFVLAVAQGATPELPDRGTGNNVLKRLSAEDFSSFYSRACEAAAQARKAFDATDPADSAKLWRELLGPSFPQPSNGGGSSGDGGAGSAAIGAYTEREEPSKIDRGRFA